MMPATPESWKSYNLTQQNIWSDTKIHNIIEHAIEDEMLTEKRNQTRSVMFLQSIHNGQNQTGSGIQSCCTVVVPGCYIFPVKILL